MKDGLPNILFSRAEFVFSLYFVSIFEEFASETTLSLSKLNSEQTSDMLGSMAGSLPSLKPFL